MWWADGEFRQFLLLRRVSNERTLLPSQQLGVEELENVVEIPRVALKVLGSLKTDVPR